MAAKTATRSDKHRESVEWLKCSADAGYFADTYAQIDEPQGSSRGVIPFALWPQQVQLFWTLMTERAVLILKARQLGISWLVCAYALWICLFNPGRVVLAFSRGQNEADELIRRVRVMYERLPGWLRLVCPKLTKTNTSDLAWANGSRMESFPATKGAGRSLTASLLIMDEFAWMQFATEVYTAAKPTIDNGGQMVILSTANGEDNLFYTLAQEAQAGTNEFAFVFLPWWIHPARNADWYAATERGMPSSALMRQEYPATPEEAFSNTGAERFLPSILWWDACKEELPVLLPREGIVLAADAGVSGDNFALIGVSRHPARPDDVAVRYVQTWQPPRNGTIDFDPIYAEVEQICRDYNVVCFTYDPYQLHYFATRLQTGGIVWCAPFNQGGDRLESDKGLLDLIAGKRIAHSGEAVLREHIDNADKQVDAQTRKLRIVKRAGMKKIDACVATAMGAHKCLELNL
jgi:hypothetical protein